MAGFEVIIYGRFWVIAEDLSLPELGTAALGITLKHLQGRPSCIPA
jgi:hypothetical protein